jgi:hypothetical protein
MAKMSYFCSMEKLILDLLQEKALKYCEMHVFEWSSLDDQLKEWYFEKVIELLQEDKQFMMNLFSERLN